MLMTTIAQLLIFMVIMYLPRLTSHIQVLAIRVHMKKLKKITNKNVLVMSHVQTGIFGNMITTSDLMKIEKEMRKFKGKDFDFILNTLGGDLFASVKIARLLHNYEGKVRVFVPKYAMSGGTMIALGADEIIMDKQASLGPIDPQVGSLFKSYSSKAWDTIVKKKGKKADDASYAMSLLGKQATKISKEIADEFIDIKNKRKKKKAVKTLIEGGVAHSYQFNYKQLRKLGLKIGTCNMILHHKIIEGLKKGGVIGI